MIYLYERMSQGREKYFSEFNLLRAFAIIAVISVHVSAYLSKMPELSFLTVTYMAVDVFSQFAVPLFIFISGFVLYNKYSDGVAIMPFYKKRFSSVLPQYLIFSSFYLAISFFGSIVLQKSIDFGFLDVVCQYLTGGCFYHLWFFVLIIQLYLLYPAIILVFSHFHTKGKSREFIILAYLVTVLWNGSNMEDYIFAGIITLFLGYVVYFILGMLVRSGYENLNFQLFSGKKQYLVSLLLFFGTLIGIFEVTQKVFEVSPFLSVSALDLSLHWLYSAITPLYYIAIIFLLLYIVRGIPVNRTPGSSILNRIASYSFGIYLVHAFVLYIAVLMFSRFGFDWTNLLFYPVMFSLTLVSSLYLVEFLRKVPHHELIIGHLR
jgi:surface polysaccharide O-acyltransferase-like enzyme